MPQKPMEHLALSEACGVDPSEKGKHGAEQVNDKAGLKENLKAFTESVHQKASQVVQWLGQIDESTNERCKKLLCSNRMSVILRTLVKSKGFINDLIIDLQLINVIGYSLLIK